MVYSFTYPCRCINHKNLFQYLVMLMIVCSFHSEQGWLFIDIHWQNLIFATFKMVLKNKWFHFNHIRINFFPRILIN